MMQVQTRRGSTHVLIALLHPCCLSAMDVVISPVPALEGEMCYSWYLGVSPPKGESAHERGAGMRQDREKPMGPRGSSILPAPKHAPILISPRPCWTWRSRTGWDVQELGTH